ncbi:hypothetical protein MED222_04885 [Vibrio sp. MED222]|nr:hypothetical protein MED222_04885 [Vibrio sp. MED222]
MNCHGLLDTQTIQRRLFLCHYLSRHLRHRYLAYRLLLAVC